MSYALNMGRPPNPRGPIGVNLARLRAERGLSQEALALKSGVSRGTIATIENGKNQNPETESLQRLARALDCDVAEILAARRLPPASEAAVQAFLGSAVWNGQVVRPAATAAEVAWLRSTALAAFGELQPTAETIARLIEARRASSAP